MNDKFYFGLVLGMLGGALIASNSAKARKAIVSGQEQVIEKIDELSSVSAKKQKSAKTENK